MADNTLTETDEDFDIIEGTPPEGDAKPEAKEDDDDSDEGVGGQADDEDDDGDDRLGESEDDHEDEVVSQTRKRRLKRREIQKRAKENAQRELEMLRHQNAELARRMAAIEGQTLQNNEQSLEQRLAQAVNEVRQAEHVMARATEAGNGDDVVAAIRIRDQAMANVQQLQSAKEQMAQARQQTAPSADPRVQSFAGEWMQANPWYNPKGGDEDSAIVNAIDASMTAQGYDPTSRAYWEELTRRVAARVGDADSDPAPTRAAAPKRKAPPQGNTREHAPTSTRKEVYVTPERKAAMIEAGIWDDPVARNRMLKAYQAYDKNGSAS